MLTVESITVSYTRGIDALSEVSLRLKKGEMLAVLGANGAGKSTLLRALSGLLPLRGGKIVLDDDDISVSSPAARVRKGLIHIPEGRQMFNTLSVEENLLLGGYVNRNAGRGAKGLLEQAYEMFPILKEKRHQPAGVLSGGQQQMVAVGRALMGKPALLICDEPSLGLAPIITEQILGSLKRICDQGIAVLLVEQNAHKALEVADRAVVLKRGRVVMESGAAELSADGSLRDVYLGS